MRSSASAGLFQPSMLTTVVLNQRGQLMLQIPRSILRVFRARCGDTVTIRARRNGDFFMRFYRRGRRPGEWLQLLRTGETRKVQRPY